MRSSLQAPEFRTWLASDGYPLRGRMWRSPGQTHALLYFHGIQSHGGWYEGSGSVLAHGGAMVVMPDRRGSGMNREARGDTPDRARWLCDIDEIADCLAQEGVKSFDVVGVSWGGKLAAAWALQAKQPVRRLLLVTPGLFPAVELAPRERLRVACSLLLNPGRMIPIPLSDAALFSDNPEGRRFIERDALKLTHVTARFLWQSHLLDRSLIEIQNAAIGAPLTLFLAGHERIIRNQPTQAWSQRVAGRGIQTQWFETACHTLEFEPDTGAYFGALQRWVSAT